MAGKDLQAYEIRVREHIEASWLAHSLGDWFGQVVVRHETDGETTFICPPVDQTMLNALLNRFYALNIRLVSVIQRN